MTAPETIREPTPGEGPTAPRPVPPSVTMPLLARITQQSLDEDYLHVARRRRTAQSRADAPTGRRHGGGSLTVVAVVAFGVLVAVAAVQTSRTAPVRAEGRAVLISQIDDRQTEVSRQHQRIAELSDDNTRAESHYAGLGRQLQQASRRAQQLASVTGFGPVAGAGVRITVDDAPGAGVGRLVQDHDLAGIFDGLWSVGATAISVNGQRVTTRSAPRNSGTVIRINGVSLTAPYVISALGDDRTLLAKFAESDEGHTFTTLVDSLGMPHAMTNVDHLQLPAAPTSLLQLRYAQSVQPGAAASTSPSTHGKQPQEEH